MSWLKEVSDQEKGWFEEDALFWIQRDIETGKYQVSPVGVASRVLALLRDLDPWYVRLWRKFLRVKAVRDVRAGWNAGRRLP